jgi:adenylylsulfate kinase-like enzyme
MTSTITVTVCGPVGCGKSAIAGEIEIALRAIGIPVRYADPIAAQSEKNMTHADWQTYLEMYEPSVVLVESIERARKQKRRLL